MNEAGKQQRLGLRISGRVQGVGYRASTQRKAYEMGLVGFVRNEPNGDVYAEIEGPAQLLEDMLAWCWQGPTFAKVTHIAIKELAPRHDPSFVIQYA